MAVDNVNLRPDGGGSNANRLDLWNRIISGAIAVLFPIQAFLGTDAFFKNNETARNSHEMLGNLFFLLAIASLVIGFLSMRNGTESPVMVGIRALFVLLVVAQLGLGYSGRENIDAKLWHVANGVLSTVVAAIMATTAFIRRSPATR
jgi:4-amino-4-deoxy-L-arabinose transferase-like glycosyltransferase